MPTFSADCIVGTTGRPTRRQIKAPNAHEARTRLRDLGFFATGLSEAGTPIRNKKVGRKHLIAFFHELAELLHGISLIEALEVIRTSFPNRALRVMAGEIQEKCATAAALPPAAFALYPRTFTPDIVAMIEAGEAGGAAGLSARFRDLEERLRFAEERRKAFIGAISYPVGLLAFMVAMMAYVFVYVVPKLQEILTAFRAEMPELTQILFKTADVVRLQWPWIIGAAVLPFVAVALLRRWDHAAVLMDRALLALPLLGNWLRENITADVASNYRSLYKAGKKPPEILQSSAAIVTNREARRIILQMQHWVTYEGLAPEEAFVRAKLFPPSAVMSFATAVKSARIEEQMKYIAENSSRRAREQSARFFGVFKIVLLFIIAAMVGFVVYGLLAPMFQLAMHA